MNAKQVADSILEALPAGATSVAIRDDRATVTIPNATSVGALVLFVDVTPAGIVVSDDGELAANFVDPSDPDQIDALDGAAERAGVSIDGPEAYVTVFCADDAPPAALRLLAYARHVEAMGE
jgi:hypothetical protein